MVFPKGGKEHADTFFFTGILFSINKNWPCQQVKALQCCTVTTIYTIIRYRKRIEQGVLVMFMMVLALIITGTIGCIIAAEVSVED
ncbi:hypothetical protein DRW41_22365 [Neobacillus piezotolerans]|uniref:Uncharacterized protein n=1 Tax=Neobacillus piezotolerans TaxID=2259171 RepID=A0A3D8GJZ7_9BACI|nr:hypothetical protein [Neobacillus piezotolerans]RDU34651.1 hypothetical protein DRW41_22365 [Neobacillus piezotolerans]